MQYKKQVVHGLRLNLIFRIHNEIILPIDGGSLSVDEAYSKLIRLIYRMNNHLSINFREKLKYIMEFASISYAAENDAVSNQQLDNLPKLFFMDSNSFLN